MDKEIKSDLGKNADGKHSPDATDAVGYECAAGIVQARLTVQDARRTEDEESRNTPNDNRLVIKRVVYWPHWCFAEWPQGRCTERWWRCLRRGSPWCSWPSCRRGWCGRRSSSRGRAQLQLLQMCWAVSEPLPSQTAANVFLPHQKCLLSSWQGNPTWKLKCIFYDIRSLPGDEEAR